MGIPIANIGLTCWLASLIQSLVHCSSFVNNVENNARRRILNYSRPIEIIVEILILCRYKTSDGTLLCTLFNECNGSILGRESHCLRRLEELWTHCSGQSRIMFDIHEVYIHFFDQWNVFDDQSIFNFFRSTVQMSTSVMGVTVTTEKCDKNKKSCLRSLGVKVGCNLPSTSF